MPHAQTMPAPGFQALILCGPGASLSPFTTNVVTQPKAILPIANRPMIWYPLDLCYRMGITSIHLVTPPLAEKAISNELERNPHLTSLPLPKPDILAPADLTEITATADIFRLPEVQRAITGDFLVLPCDLICELPGDSLLEAWMVLQAGLGGATGPRALVNENFKMSIGGERGGRRGGLGVWYPTKGEALVKGEETDLVAVSALEHSHFALSETSLIRTTSSLLYSAPITTVNDICKDKKTFPIRYSLVRKASRFKLITDYRDAHLYFFPYWVMEMIKCNERMDSISEDIVGWWAKCSWQDGLAEKLNLPEIFQSGSIRALADGTVPNQLIEEDLDLSGMSGTSTSHAKKTTYPSTLSPFASRVVHEMVAEDANSATSSTTVVPPMLAYIHPSRPDGLIIRRVDTHALLLNTSLQLAKIRSIEEVGSTAASPFAHKKKLAYREGKAKKCTVTENDSLLAENVTVEEKCVVKECVIGANCKIETGARLKRCVLMDGVEVGAGCNLNDCVLGTRCRIGKNSELTNCQVQAVNVVPDGTSSRNEVFMLFEGLDDATEGDLVDEEHTDGERAFQDINMSGENP